jgi:hypothetical protein
MQVYDKLQQLKAPHFPPRMYVCILHESSNKLIIYLHKMNWLVSVTEVDHVVRNGSMYIIWTTEVFKDVAIDREALRERHKQCPSRLFATTLYIS